MKIGIMGGTFDPIHNGHLLLGKEAYQQFDLDEVWFMPNGNPPHKQSRSIRLDARHRLELVRLAISGFAKFRLEEYEAKRDAVSYTYETMEYFHSKYSSDKFYFIIGADSLFAIESWVHPERIFPLCTILAAYRDEIDTEEEMNVQIHYLQKKYHADIRLLTSSLIDVSSSELRSDLEAGRDITGLVPPEVEAYIRDNGLYRKVII